MSNRDVKLRDLIGKLSDGTLTHEDASLLNEFLKSDPIAQESYLDHLMIDGLLEREFGGAVAAGRSGDTSKEATDRLGDLSQPVMCPGSSMERPTSMNRTIPVLARLVRPQFSRWGLAAVLLLTAGLVAGWYFPLPRGQDLELQPLALSDAGFESGAALPVDIGTTAVAPWYGDAAQSVEQFRGVTPMEGRRMLRFVKSSAEPGNACEVYQLVDLRSVPDITDHEALVEASAFFNSHQDAVDENDYTFGITVFAFSEDPTDESGLWPMRWQQPLTFSGRQLPADADPRSWQQINSRLALPAGTQFLVVQLTVTRTDSDADNQFPGQFVDNVRLSLASAP